METNIERYTCRYGLIHDKPVINGEPSSNNGWVYSAYAGALGILDERKISAGAIKECRPLHLVRLVGEDMPPVSRDEVIGMVSTEEITVYMLEVNSWYVHGLIPNVPLWTQLKAAWKIRKQHRNYFWQKGIIQVFPLAFTIWHHDRYYIKKFSNKKVTLLEWLAFHAYMLWELSVGEPARLNLLWLQLKDLDSKFWIKFIDQKKNFLEVFGEEHVFNKGE